MASPGRDTAYAWKGVRLREGRSWAYSQEKMEQFERDGRLVYSRGGIPRFKRYLDEARGVPLQDIWMDILPVTSQGAARMG